MFYREYQLYLENDSILKRYDITRQDIENISNPFIYMAVISLLIESDRYDISSISDSIDDYAYQITDIDKINLSDELIYCDLFPVLNQIRVYGTDSFIKALYDESSNICKQIIGILYCLHQKVKNNIQLEERYSIEHLDFDESDNTLKQLDIQISVIFDTEIFKYYFVNHVSMRNIHLTNKINSIDLLESNYDKIINIFDIYDSYIAPAFINTDYSPYASLLADPQFHTISLLCYDQNISIEDLENIKEDVYNIIQNKTHDELLLWVYNRLRMLDMDDIASSFSYILTRTGTDMFKAKLSMNPSADYLWTCIIYTLVDRFRD